MHEIFLKFVELVDSFGYLGVFVMTFIESTFIPIPSEITLIPAGFLISKGHMNFWLALASSTLGILGGSLFNYWIARYYGRMLLVRYSKYFFITEKKLKSIEAFFEKHGAISAFSGRILPGIKHFIAFPAGLGKMDIKLFCIYTCAGGLVWNCILLSLGYYIGENEFLIRKYMKQLNILILLAFSLVAYIYYLKYRKK